MGLERRGNGVYYYRKERRGDRVVSVYQGKGELARLMHAWHQLEKAEMAAAENERENVKRRYGEVDGELDEIAAEAKAVETALFLINGYREHSRQWRRRR